MKIGIVYFSQTGHTRTMAEAIKRGMAEIEGIEPVLIDIKEEEGLVDDVRACSGVVFGTPTYMATSCYQMSAFIQTYGPKLQLGGKLGGAFSTAQFACGGADIALQDVLKSLMVLGMMVYSGGSSLGQPFTHLGPVAIGTTEEQKQALAIAEEYGRRFARQCHKVMAD